MEGLIDLPEMGDKTHNKNWTILSNTNRILASIILNVIKQTVEKELADNNGGFICISPFQHRSRDYTKNKIERMQ